MSYTIRTPCKSPYSPYTGEGMLYNRSADNLMASSSRKASAPGEVPQIAVSNHGDEAIIPASAYSDSSHKSSRASSVASIHNQRVDFYPSPLMNLPGVSPSCLALDGNANGYFGIPLNCNSEARRGSDLSPLRWSLHCSRKTELKTAVALAKVQLVIFPINVVQGKKVMTHD